MEHNWKLLETRQWSGGGGHVATEKCSSCGLVTRTSVGYGSKEPAQRGNDGAVDTEERAAADCQE